MFRQRDGNERVLSEVRSATPPPVEPPALPHRRPDGPGERSPGMRPQADSPGPGRPIPLRPEGPREGRPETVRLPRRSRRVRAWLGHVVESRISGNVLWTINNPITV